MVVLSLLMEAAVVVVVDMVDCNEDEEVLNMSFFLDDSVGEVVSIVIVVESSAVLGSGFVVVGIVLSSEVAGDEIVEIFDVIVVVLIVVFVVFILSTKLFHELNSVVVDASLLSPLVVVVFS